MGSVFRVSLVWCFSRVIVAGLGARPRAGGRVCVVCVLIVRVVSSFFSVGNVFRVGLVWCFLGVTVGGFRARPRAGGRVCLLVCA